MPYRRGWLATLVCALGGGAAAVAGCIDLGAYQCQDASDCNRSPEGMCGPEGFCAYPDEDCDSGFSYQGAGSRDGECVGVQGDSSMDGMEAEDTGTTEADTGGDESESVGDESPDPDMGPESGCGDMVVEPGEFCLDPDPASINVGVGPFSIQTFHFDDDGFLDFVVSTQTADQLLVFFGNGDGTFEEGPSRAVMGDLWEVETGDFNGDALNDVLVGDPDANEVRLYLQGPMNTLLDPIGLPAVDPVSIAVADMNGDDLLDIVASIDEDTGGITVLLGDGAGGLLDTKTYIAGTRTFGVDLLDIDGDDDIDVISTNRTANSATVYINNGQGGLDFDLDVEPAFTTGLQPSFPAVADFDGDDDEDIVIANLGSNNASIYNNTGGTFAIAETFQTCTAPGVPLPADVDQDGDLDVLAPCIGGNVVIAFNDGTGVIESSIEVEDIGLPAEAAVGDFNGDGALDFITTDIILGSHVRVFIQEP